MTTESARWRPLTGREAVVATLRAKLDIARLRGEADAAARYEAQLRELGES